MNAQPMSFGFGFWLNWLFEENKYGRKSTNRAKPHSHSLKWRHFSWFWQNAKTSWDGPDKMPTKNWDGQNANHNKKSGHNANLWLAFRPVGILSAHHLNLHLIFEVLNMQQGFIIYWRAFKWWTVTWLIPWCWWRGTSSFQTLARSSWAVDYPWL